jgi:hypothetical protein
MFKYIRIRRFVQALFDEEPTANQAAEIGQAMLAVRSLRLTDIAAKMRGSRDASYGQVQKSRLSQQAGFHCWLLPAGHVAQGAANSRLGPTRQ